MGVVVVLLVGGVVVVFVDRKLRERRLDRLSF